MNAKCFGEVFVEVLLRVGVLSVVLWVLLALIGLATWAVR